MTRARKLIWLPSLLAGAALAAALATSAGLLLYNSRGLMRAGGVLLSVSFVSLITGILMGSAMGNAARDKAVTSAARGWTGLLAALLLGAAFAGLWETMNAFGATPVAQGVGLAVTSAMPAYFAGGVWGRMNSFAASLGAGQPLHVFVGGAVGVAAGGTTILALLGEPVLAVTILLGATVLASAGARCQGWIFDRVPRRSVMLTSPERPELRFESWQTMIPERFVRVLWDGGTYRAVDPVPPGDWRAGVVGTLDGGDRVLFIGAGSWFPVSGGRRWQVFEPDDEVRRLAAGGFGWDDGNLAGSPVPEAPGWTVVAEREAVAAVRWKSLREAGVKRVWVGGRPGHLPKYLLDDAREAAFGVSRYQGTGSGAEGPPRLVSRRHELWCYDRSQSPPEAVGGMKTVLPEAPSGSPWINPSEHRERRGTGRAKRHDRRGTGRAGYDEPR